jgi:hypothetical protein
MTTDPLRPSVADVALLIRARTKDADGREVGTFTDETRPTDEQVEEHISAAVALLSPRWPIAIDDSYYLAVQRLTAYRAAMQIEKSVFPGASPQRSQRLRSTPRGIPRRPSGAHGRARRRRGDGSGSALGGAPSSMWTPTFLYASQYLDPLDHWPEPENPANWRQPLQPPREPPLPEDLPVGDEPASGRVLP